jgi:ferredoxin-thioredoxin reductase catalytic subunit
MKTKLTYLRKTFLEFAIEHKLVINPSLGYTKHSDSINRLGCCPCDNTRKACPCEQALGEVESMGHCLCQLFWKDYQTYLDDRKM